jgi:hypothetical protein
MSFSSDKNSYPFSYGCLELLIELINTDFVTEIKDRLIIVHTPKDDNNVQSHKDIIVSWTSYHWKLVSDVLLSDQELDLGPRQA